LSSRVDWKLLSEVSNNLQLLIYVRLWQRKFKEVMKKLTPRVQKIRNLKIKVIFYHVAGRDNQEVMHIQQH
jgi:hypothetical protein